MEAYSHFIHIEREHRAVHVECNPSDGLDLVSCLV